MSRLNSPHISRDLAGRYCRMLFVVVEVWVTIGHDPTYNHFTITPVSTLTAIFTPPVTLPPGDSFILSLSIATLRLNKPDLRQSTPLKAQERTRNVPSLFDSLSVREIFYSTASSVTDLFGSLANPVTNPVGSLASSVPAKRGFSD